MQPDVAGRFISSFFTLVFGDIQLIQHYISCKISRNLLSFLIRSIFEDTTATMTPRRAIRSLADTAGTLQAEKLDVCLSAKKGA